MCSSLNHVTKFHNSDCVLQDLNSQRTIGLANQVEGLYRLVVDEKNIGTSSVHAAVSEMIPKSAL